jgi:hydroxymethylbilane synthase
LVKVPKLRVGTRASLLATTQTRLFTELLKRKFADLEIVEVLITTEGDTTETPLSESKTPGVFVSALRDALLANRVDFIVHSMKDLPAKPHPQIATACVPMREDPRDGLVANGGFGLQDLPAGSLVGTSSPRRAATIRKLRPDLRVASIRGNVDSRIAKVRSGQYDATLLAMAGLNRIGRESEANEQLDLSEFVPAPGQGALSVECRAQDLELRDLLSLFDDPITRLTTAAERSVLVGLSAGCATAIGAHAVYDGSSLRLTAELADAENGDFIRVVKTSSAATENLNAAFALGIAAADELLLSDIAKRAHLQ